MEYSVKLTAREVVARETMAFYFEKPKGFTFKAGQYLDVTLINPPETDDEGNIRSFSIASAPFEQHLMIAMRMRKSAFKRVMKMMPLGTVVKIEGPLGSFTLHNNASHPAVFLAGGIGITPFLSIIRQKVHDKLPHALYLFYSNRRLQDAAFLSQLQELQTKHRHFQFIATMTKLGKSKTSWQGHTGYIDEEMIKQYISDLKIPIYYIAGPPAMVGAMQQLLYRLGIDSDTIKLEEFSGY